MTDNLKLWRSVETTKPEHTHKANIGGQQRTSVKAIFQKEKATEIFGIQGIKWGVVVGSESYERIICDSEQLLQYTAAMFFLYDGEKGEIPIAAAIKEGAIAKRGKPDQYLRIDHEAIKKVRTDAMTKGLSELGFNADIFKGLYDLNGYSEYASSITTEKETDEREQADIKAAEDYAEWKAKELDAYRHLQTVRAVTTANTGHTRKATAMGDMSGVKQFADAKEKRIEEIKCQASTN